MMEIIGIQATTQSNLFGSPVPNEIQWIATITGLIAFLGWMFSVLKPASKAFWQEAEEQSVVNKRHLMFGVFYAALCAAIWAFSFASLGRIRPEVGVISSTVYLMGFAAAALYVTAFLIGGCRRPTFSPESKKFPKITIMVFVNLVNFLGSIYALKYITPTASITIANISPLVVAFVLISRGQLRMSGAIISTMLMIFIGIVLINMDSNFQLLSGPTWRGIISSVAVGFSFGLWAILTRDASERMPTIAAQLWFLGHVFGASYLILISIDYFFFPKGPLQPGDYLILLLNGARVAVVYALFFSAVRYAGPLIAGVTAVLMVPMSFPCDKLLNGAVQPLPVVFGAILIGIAAVGLIGNEYKKAPPSSKAS